MGLLACIFLVGYRMCWFCPKLQLLAGESYPLAWAIINFIATLLLVCSSWAIRRSIVDRFSIIRLKEVDTVYEAYHLVTRRPTRIRDSRSAPEPETND